LGRAEGLVTADVVVTDARIHTARPQRGMAEALAVKDGGKTVIPFIQAVQGNSYEALHPPDSYYESNVYPVRSSKEAGAILVAGSDAPVDSADPRPSIEVGKSGDFIVLNQDILKLADEGHADDIRNTDVLETWFMGKRVYVGNVDKTNAKRGLQK
jgi:predicted amidohydrolase YtcJ